MSGPYSIIYADPPWRFETYNRETGTHGHQSRSAERHYPTLTEEELRALPVHEWAAKNSLLCLWVYDPQVPLALEIARAWGFEYVTVLFRWLKSANGQQRLFDPGERLAFGHGYHTRGGGCEECFLFRRGKGLPVLRHDIRKEFFSTIREHSRKPDEVADWIVKLYGDVPRLELFARTRRPGWQAQGNEPDKFE